MNFYIDFDDTIYKTVLRLEELAECEIKVFDITKYGLGLEVFSREDFFQFDSSYLIEGALEYIDKIRHIGNVTILTKYVSETEKTNKLKLIEFFGLDDYLVIFVPIDGDKQSYLSNGDFLVDDQMSNLKPNKTNILFDYRGEFNRSWNHDPNNEYVKCFTWETIYKYILFNY